MCTCISSNTQTPLIYRKPTFICWYFIIKLFRLHLLTIRDLFGWKKLIAASLHLHVQLYIYVMQLCSHIVVAVLIFTIKMLLQTS